MGPLEMLQIDQRGFDVVGPVSTHPGVLSALVLRLRPAVPVVNRVRWEQVPDGELAGTELLLHILQGNRVVVERLSDEQQLVNGNRVDCAAPVVNVHAQQVYAPRGAHRDYRCALAE